MGTDRKAPWEIAGGGRPAHRHSFYSWDRKQHWNDLFERAIAKLPESQFSGLSGIIQDIVCMIEAYPDIQDYLQGRDGPRVVEELVRREGFVILSHPDVWHYVLDRRLRQMWSKSTLRPESRFSLRRRGERGPGKLSEERRIAAAAARARVKKKLIAAEERNGKFAARIVLIEGRVRRQRDGERVPGFERALDAALAAELAQPPAQKPVIRKK